ncbi:MAG TPA: universal stress protein [Burkholderiaceae bacterium]|nr:universal stress protein [Burkholderiaceae bacterium]
MKILIAVDGSACSRAAVRFVAARLVPHGESGTWIELLNVQNPIPVYAARVAGSGTVHAFHESEAKRALAPAQKILLKAGVAANSRYLVGSAGAVVSGVAARDADLVVMGSHGRTSLGGVLFGSVTHTVLATCTKPLLIVRAKNRVEHKRQAPLRVGIAVDGSKQSRAAVRYVLEHRALFGAGAEVTLITVVPDLLAGYLPAFAEIPMPAFSPENAIELQNEAFESAMRPARALLKARAMTWPEVRLVGNVPGDRIAAYAKKNRLDLLVMGSHGHGVLKSVALGSVATRTAARCATPLLLIHSAESSRKRRDTKARAHRLAPV